MSSQFPIVSQQEVAPRYFQLTIRAPEIAGRAQAGQFVHILPRAAEARDPLLRRAFSIFQTEGENFSVLYRIAGRGTDAMSRWRVGQETDVIGPLGQPFQAASTPALLVGGGVGVPPLAMLASRKTGEHPFVALIGARTANDVLCVSHFKRYGVPVEVATEDGSAGQQGFVTALLQSHLIALAESGEVATIYSCGPLPMLRAVAQLCAQYKMPCQVSLEENMPCGVGVCNGCVVPVIGAGDDYGRYRRICVDGPALWADEIDWSHWSEPTCP